MDRYPGGFPTLDRMTTSREVQILGGYETWLGTNRVQEDTSVILTNNLLEMLAELKKAE